MKKFKPWKNIATTNDSITINFSADPCTLLEMLGRAEGMGFGPRFLLKYRPLVAHIATGLITAISITGNENAVAELYKTYGRHDGVTLTRVRWVPTGLFRDALYFFASELVNGYSAALWAGCGLRTGRLRELVDMFSGKVEKPASINNPCQ